MGGEDGALLLARVSRLSATPVPSEHLEQNYLGFKWKTGAMVDKKMSLMLLVSSKAKIFQKQSVCTLTDIKMH